MKFWRRRCVSRSHRLFLNDIVSACLRLRDYRDQVSWNEPESSRMAIDPYSTT